MRGRRAQPNITVVIGPPCSGKTTAVRGRARPGDVVIDFDAIAQALGSREHDHPKAHGIVAAAARRAAIGATLSIVGVKVWVILTHRHQIAEFGLAAAEVLRIDTPLDECERRARAQRRSPRVIDVIRHWAD